MAPHPVSPPTKIVIIDISEEDYSLEKIERTWPEQIGRNSCPCGGPTEQFVRHSVYEKYLYFTCVPILRVRCRSCGHNHALIPSFSVPGTSLCLDELESFIFTRAGEASRMESGIVFRQRRVFCADYLRSLERRILAGTLRAEALFLHWGNNGLPPLAMAHRRGRRIRSSGIPAQHSSCSGAS